MALSLSSLPLQVRQALIVKSKVSVSRIASFSRSKIMSIGIVTSLYFSSLKTSSQSQFQIKGISLQVSLVNGVAIPKNPLINFLQQFTKPRKAYISLTFVSFSYSLTNSTLLRLGLIPLLDTIQPRKPILCLQNSYLLSFTRRSFFLSFQSTIHTY